MLDLHRRALRVRARQPLHFPSRRRPRPYEILPHVPRPERNRRPTALSPFVRALRSDCVYFFTTSPSTINPVNAVRIDQVEDEAGVRRKGALRRRVEQAADSQPSDQTDAARPAT